MANSKMYKCFKEVTDCIEENEDYDEIRRDLARSILCGPELQTKGKILQPKSELRRGFKNKYSAFLSLIRQSQLPEALWAHYKYSLPKAKILQNYKINKSDWHVLEKFISDTLANDDSLPQILAAIQHHAFEENNIRYEVIFDEKAMDDILIAATEGYLSPKKQGGTYYETFGVCLGTMTNIQNARSNTKSEKRIIHVSKCPPQISSQASYDRFKPMDESYAALEKVRKHSFPQFSIVGEFHSHPYDNLADLRDCRGRKNSEKDAKRWAWAKKSGDYGDLHFALVVAITQLRKKRAVGMRYLTDNHLCFNIEDLRVHLSGTRILSSGNLSERNLKIRFSKMMA